MPNTTINVADAQSGDFVFHERRWYYLTSKPTSISEGVHQVWGATAFDTNGAHGQAIFYGGELERAPKDNVPTVFGPANLRRKARLTTKRVEILNRKVRELGRLADAIDARP